MKTDRVARRRAQWQNTEQSFEMLLQKYFDEVAPQELSQFLGDNESLKKVIVHKRQSARLENMVDPSLKHQEQSLLPTTDSDAIQNFVPKIDISDDAVAVAQTLMKGGDLPKKEEKKEEEVHPGLNVASTKRKEKLKQVMASE